MASRESGADPVSPCTHSEGDLQLVRDALEGRSGSPEALVERLRCLARFLSALNTRAGRPFDSHELSDLVQDSLLIVWRKLDRFQGPEGLDAWVLRIARYEYQNAVRKKARRSVQVETLELAEHVPAPGDETDRWLEQQTVHQVLQELEPRAAETVHLKHYAGLTFDEIGERMGCSANTAKTRYYRSIARLASALESMEP